MNGFATFEDTDLAALRAICGAARVTARDDIGEDFLHDELGDVRGRPDARVRVLSTAEISAVLRHASARRLPVTVRGSGTGLVGGAVPVFGGILLDTSGMTRILELDEKNMTLTVEPGVLLMDVAKYVEERDFFYPPDPGEKTATIGGNISTNAGGMRAVKYGVTRDYVRALEVVLPSGEVLELGGKVAKNSSGYSLKDLIVGSEGTLAVVAKATLRLLPLPKFKISLLVPFPDLASAIETVPSVIRASSIPTAVEFMERDVILAAEKYQGRKFPDRSADAYLLLTFDGASQGEIDLATEAAAETCLAAGASDVFLSDTQERNEAIWSARGAFLEAIKASTTEMDECDVVVPRSRVAEFILFARSIQKKHGIRILSFGHAGDGNLHIYVLRDALGDEAWRAALSGTFDDLYGRARELGGQVSGEHGIGFAKKSYLGRSLPPEQIALMRAVKAAFDPLGILNPGKVVSGGPCRPSERNP